MCPGHVSFWGQYDPPKEDAAEASPTLPCSISTWGGSTLSEFRKELQRRETQVVCPISIWKKPPWRTDDFAGGHAEPHHKPQKLGENQCHLEKPRWLMVTRGAVEYEGWITGWWWLEHGFYDFPIILGMSSSQLTFTPSFFRGVAKNHQPEYCYIYNHH